MPRRGILEDIGDIATAEFVWLDRLDKGRVVKSLDLEKDAQDSVHYQIRNMRELVQDIYKLYSSDKKPSRKDFLDLIDKKQRRAEDEIQNFLDTIERPQDLLRVEEKTDDGKTVIIRMTRIDQSEKIKLIKSIAEKLANKLTKEQVRSMLEEGIKKNNDLAQLKRVEKKLEKKSPEIKGRKGCFSLVVDDEDLFVIS